MTTTDERHALIEAADKLGWTRRDLNRVDHYVRWPRHVRVVWQGDDAISGGSLYDESELQSHTRDLATVKGWLAR